jgi:hypothetical protein
MFSAAWAQQGKVTGQVIDNKGNLNQAAIQQKVHLNFS